MARLTSFSKFLITLLIVGVVFFGVQYFMNNTDTGKELREKAQVEQNDSSDGEGASDPNTIGVGVVTWGGYAGGQYWNKGFKPNTESNYYKDHGFKVDFKILDDPTASRNAWKNDEVQLLWATIDALPTEMPGLAAYDPVVVFQADWSRGGDAIVVRRGIASVGDLRGKQIAVAEMSPSHSFLIWLLGAAGMTTNVKDDGDAYILNGAKMWITNAPVADVAVVWAKTDLAEGARGVRGFVVPTDTPGFSAPEIKHKMSLRASITGEIVLEDVRLPASAMLPGVEGLRGPLSCLNEARFGIVFGAIGAARDCLQTAIDYAGTREVFDKPLAGYQITQTKVADMALEVGKGFLLAMPSAVSEIDAIVARQSKG